MRVYFLLLLSVPAAPSTSQLLTEDPPPIASAWHQRQSPPQYSFEERNILNRRLREADPQAPIASSTSNNTYKVVCYFTNYAWYRSGIGKFGPRDIDPQLCTNIVYGYALLDPDQLFIKTSDSWADIELKLYQKVTSLKKRGVKVSIAIGGWVDSAGDKYSRMVNSPTSRRRFIEHLLQFIYQHDFDGLELDWEFPKCWQLNCNAGPDSDKAGFGALVRELRAAFKPLGLLLSAAVPPTKHPVDVGYNVPLMSEKLDWISVKTYDYHGHWDGRTGHGAPLYANADDDDYTFFVNFTINYWISQGADSHKLVLGIPMFGNTFKLSSKEDNGLYAYTSGPGDVGEHSKNPGILAYYEICERTRNRGWEVKQEAAGPFARHNDQWVSYNDRAMVRRKAEYVKQYNLGGVMIFSLDYEDFRNNCGEGKFPLLRAINSVLRPQATDPSSSPSVEQHTTERQTTKQQATARPTTPEQQTTQRQTTEQHTPELHTTASPSAAQQPSKVVCYFTNWAWYRQGLGKYLPQNIVTNLCTHINYAFASLDPQTLTVQPKDPWTDLDNDFFRQVTKLREKGVKVLLGLGGWDDSQGDKYSRLVNDPSARAHFIQHLSEFLRRYNFDGLNLHWEYPTCWQLDCNAGPASDKESFATLVKELSRELKPRGMLMSAIVSRNSMVVEKAYDVKTLSVHLDWLELKTFEYRGYWDKRTGLGAPLYYTAGDISPYMNVNFSVNYWLGAGAPREKLVLGMPMHGQTFTLADPSQASLGAPTQGPGSAGAYTNSPGIMAFYEICEMVHGEGWKVEKHSFGTTAQHNNQWVSYDDISDVQQKAQYIKDMGLGGAMVWTLDLDDFNNNCGCGSYPLLTALNRGLHGSSLPPDPPQAATNNCPNMSFDTRHL